MSSVELDEREVILVRAAAIARRFLDPVAHLARQQFVAFLGLLSAADVEEYARHRPSVDADLATRCRASEIQRTSLPIIVRKSIS